MSESGSEDEVWDVEKYKVDYESEEHWELRKVEESFICSEVLFTNFCYFLFRHSWKLIVTSSLKMRSSALLESSQTLNSSAADTPTKS